MKKINITNDLNITNKTKSPSSEIEEYAYDVDVLKHLSETLENNSPKIKKSSKEHKIKHKTHNKKLLNMFKDI